MSNNRNALKQMIKLIKSTFYKEEDTKKKLCDFIKTSKQLSFGIECEKFEKTFARWQGRKYCIFLNSGSSANLALIQALLNTKKIKKGDSIGFSALTWSTNVMPLIQLGFKAIPVDVELNTINVSSRTLKEVLRKNEIKMLFLTNLLGFCSDIDEIKKICDGNKILLIEDNCESLGTVYKKKLLGNYGSASTFSFYTGHHMSTIEGGAICTDSKELATMLQIVRAHGWDRNISARGQKRIRSHHNINSSFYSRYTFYDLGFNLRPTEINGYLGNIQIQYLDEIIRKRNENFIELAKVIYSRQGKYIPLEYNHIDFVSNFAFPVICRSKKIRDELVEKCKGKIEIRPVVGGNIIEQPFFVKYMGRVLNMEKANAHLVHEQGLYFANNPELTIQEIREIKKVFTS